MEKDREPPFPREPWQRLLQDRADAPPETTDARIRAKAQKAVAPRAARWWLPASLAASFLISVLLVQSQFGREEKSTVVTEADLAAPAAAAPPAAAEDSSLVRDRVAESGAVERKDSASSELHYEVAPEDIEPELEAGADEERIATNGAQLSGPEQELKAASEMEPEMVDAAAPPPNSGVVARDAPTTPIATQVDMAPPAAARADAAGTLAKEAAPPQRTPEAWYAEIKALRKAGRNKEADAELARFEAAYPGWLKKQGLRKP
jgi:hypothetical protein